MKPYAIILLSNICLAWLTFASTNCYVDAQYTMMDLCTNPTINETILDKYGPYEGMSEILLWQNMPKLRRIRWEPRTGELARIQQWINAADDTIPGFRYKIPIQFYGVVRDYSSNVVTNATVWYQWLSTNGTLENTIYTDTNGYFVISNICGNRIGIRVSKTGYAKSPAAMTSFNYSTLTDIDFYSPDQTKPYVFLLKKLGKIAPVVSSYPVKYNIPEDGEQAWVDPVKGVFVTNEGHFAFSVFRSNLTIKAYVPQYYRITVQAAPGIGICRSVGDDFLFDPPADGYVSSFVIEEQPGKQYRLAKKIEFYFRTADGKYGSCKANVGLALNVNVADVLTSIVFNPTGERNLTH